MTEQEKLPEIVPILASSELVVFPSMLMPLAVGKESWVRAIDSVAPTHKTIALFYQPESVDPPTLESLAQIGCSGRIVRMLRLPDGSIQLLFQAVRRVRATELTQTEPFATARIEPVAEFGELTMETKGLAENLRAQFQKLISEAPNMPEEMGVVAANLDEPGRIADFVAANSDLSLPDKQRLLEELDINERLRQATVLVTHELEVVEIGSRIQSQIRSQMDKTQREYYLREQLKAIQQELGETNENEAATADLRQRIEAAGMSDEARKQADHELERLTQMNPMSPEVGIIRTYLEWMVSLPWSASTPDNLDLTEAKHVLDQDHYDLEKVKDRILDYLAVRKLKADMRGPILCFVGPPGVGKTSLGQSIARALGRKFVRMSLGGVRDEAEIRGHRRTYVGALPGRVLQGIRRAETNNPVFMLDEVDKLGADYRGDPSAALLEVLDPEQNHSFVDHYLDVAFDLSRVMFIATANMLETMPPALLDRMEVIELAGYSEEQKLEIARRYLIPKQVREHGISPEALDIPEDTLRTIIQRYTREAGVRNLEREIATICRHAARRIAEGGDGQTAFTPTDLDDLLGAPRFRHEAAEGKDEVGVATGLAWTPVGGDILFVEARAVPGHGGLILTGHLGEVMRESAQAALTYLRSRADALGLPPDFHERMDIHVHVPAGAIPKDGPSAGVTIASAMISALTRRPILHNVAMTGEITLRGRVLPVGGIPDKVLAAHRSGIDTVALPRENERDLNDIPEHIRRELTFVLVEHMDEVLRAVLQPEPVPEEPNLEPVRAGTQSSLAARGR